MDKSKKNLLSALQFIDNPYIWIKARRKMKNIVKSLFSLNLRFNGSYPQSYPHYPQHYYYEYILLNKKKEGMSA